MNNDGLLFDWEEKVDENRRRMRMDEYLAKSGQHSLFNYMMNTGKIDTMEDENSQDDLSLSKKESEAAKDMSEEKNETKNVATSDRVSETIREQQDTESYNSPYWKTYFEQFREEHQYEDQPTLPAKRDEKSVTLESQEPVIDEIENILKGDYKPYHMLGKDDAYRITDILEEALENYEKNPPSVEEAERIINYLEEKLNEPGAVRTAELYKDRMTPSKFINALKQLLAKQKADQQQVQTQALVNPGLTALPPHVAAPLQPYVGINVPKKVSDSLPLPVATLSPYTKALTGQKAQPALPDPSPIQPALPANNNALALPSPIQPVEDKDKVIDDFATLLVAKQNIATLLFFRAIRNAQQDKSADDLKKNAIVKALNGLTRGNSNLIEQLDALARENEIIENYAKLLENKSVDEILQLQEEVKKEVQKKRQWWAIALANKAKLLSARVRILGGLALITAGFVVPSLMPSLAAAAVVLKGLGVVGTLSAVEGMWTAATRIYSTAARKIGIAMLTNANLKEEHIEKALERNNNDVKVFAAEQVAEARKQKANKILKALGSVAAAAGYAALTFGMAHAAHSQPNTEQSEQNSSLSQAASKSADYSSHVDNGTNIRETTPGANGQDNVSEHTANEYVTNNQSNADNVANTTVVTEPKIEVGNRVVQVISQNSTEVYEMTVQRGDSIWSVAEDAVKAYAKAHGLQLDNDQLIEAANHLKNMIKEDMRAGHLHGLTPQAVSVPEELGLEKWRALYGAKTDMVLTSEAVGKKVYIGKEMIENALKKAGIINGQLSDYHLARLGSKVFGGVKVKLVKI